MASFVKLALFASLRNMRSTTLGRNLKALILRFLLLWPRILRSLRKVWLWYFQTSFSDEMKMEGDNGEPSMGTLRKREECTVVCASRDSGGVGGPSRHSISGSSYAEQSIPMEIVIRRTHSVPHSLSSSHSPSPQGSPRLSAALFPSGSPHALASSSRTESPRLLPAPFWSPPFLISDPPAFRMSTQISTTNARNFQSQPDMPLVRPIHSGQVSRYVKKGDVPRVESEFRLLPMNVDLPHSYQFRDSGIWIPVTHPEGALYFYHERMKIFTDVYMYDPVLREEVYKSVEVLATRLQYGGIPFPTANYDLVLDIIEIEDGTKLRLYYFVDHDTRTMFWLDPYDMRNLLSGACGVKEPGHIKTLLEALYWVHWSLYPVGYRGRNFPTDAPKELLGVLLSSSIDSLTSKVSTAPYSVADMQTMSDIINKTKDLGPENPHTIYSVARLLSVYVRWSIYEDKGHKRTVPFRQLSLILFFIPDAYFRELKEVSMDDIIVEEVWRNLMIKLVSEWMDFVLYSTVMLTANVGFLAIQGVIVVPSSGGWIKASPAQIASSVSLVFSIGSIVTGLLVIRRNRTMATKDRGTAVRSSKYLYSMKRPFFHLEPLAVIFSLTYGLLMWSVFVFFIALLLFSFQNATKKIRIFMGVASGMVIILIIFCITSLSDRLGLGLKYWLSGEGYPIDLED